MRIKALVSLAMAAELLLFNQIAFAHTLATGTHNSNFTPHSTPVTSPTFANSVGAVNLDLSSSKATISAGNMALANALNINVGGHMTSVNAQSMLTAAEFVAAMQVSAGGVQTLQLSAQGNAVGGRFSLPASLSQDVGNLVIPQGVKELDNAALTPLLSLSGDLTDAGKFVAFTTNPQDTSAQVSASNIYVEAGGLLTSVTSHGAAPVDLSLSALNSFSNAGVVSSSGNLSLYAGSGNFTNSGTISTVTGNINVGALSTSDINFNGTGGTMQAQNGAINFRAPGYSGSANMNLNGGNYLSQSLNLNSGSGSVNINVGQVTGIVNTYAGSADLNANTKLLQVGVFDVSGDPWINSAGDLELSSMVTFPVDYLVATAGGNIFTSSTGIDISVTGSGTGDIVMAAGVSATPNGNDLTLSSSGLGGDVYLAQGCLSCSGTSQNISGFSTQGGDVTLIAMLGTGVNSNVGGHVVLPSNVTIDTTNGGAAGSVTIFGESNSFFGSGPAVNIGGVNAAGTGGTVTIKSASANLGGATIDSTTGTISGSFDTGSTLQYGTLTPGTVTAGGTLTMATAGRINLSGATTAPSGDVTASSIFMTSGSSIETTASLAIHAGSIKLGDGSSMSSTTISGGSVSIDDNYPGLGGGGITFIGQDGVDEYITATSGTLSVSATNSGGSGLLFQSANGTGTDFIFDSPSSVTFTASNQFTLVGANTYLINSTSTGPWSITARVVQLNSTSGINTSFANGQGGSGADLSIHTNTLELGNGASTTGIYGNSLTIDDAGLAAGGVEIEVYDGSTQNLGAEAGTLTVNATNGTANLTLTSQSGTGGTLDMDGTTAVNMTASSQIEIDTSMTVQNSQLNGAWSLTAPTVQLNDGATVSTTNGSTTASLTIQTNTLAMGNGASGASSYIEGNGVSINDTGMAPGSGVEILAYENQVEYINANGGLLRIAAINSDLNGNDQLSFNHHTGTLILDSSNAVQMLAASEILFHNSVAVGNSTSTGAWSLTAPTVQFNDGSVLDTTGSLNMASGAGADLGIHTNNLNLADLSDDNTGVALKGNDLTVDDVLFSPLIGLTITGIQGAPSTMTALRGTLAINANNSLGDELVFTGGTGVIFTMEGTSGVNMTAMGEVEFDQNVTVQNSSTVTPHGAWSITAPTVQLNGGSLLSVSNGSTNLTIHTNYLGLGDGSTTSTVSISASNNLTVDDAGMTNGGVSVVALDGSHANGPESMYAGGTLNVNATNGTLLFSSLFGTGATILLDSPHAVNLTASAQMTFDVNMTIANSTTSGDWSVTSPIVQFNDGATLATTESSGPATLAIHTEYLYLGDGVNESVNIYGNGITIDDNGGTVFTTGGFLTIGLQDNEESIYSVGGTLAINANGSPSSSLLLQSAGNSGSFLSLDGDKGVTLTANSQIEVLQNMYVANSVSSGNWTVTAPTVALSDGAEIDTSEGPAPVTLAIHTNNLNLGDGSNGSAATVQGNGVTIDDNGGSVFSTTGLTITARIDPGFSISSICSFGKALAINATASPSSTLLFTSNNLNLPAIMTLDADGGVMLSAANQIVIDENVDVTNRGTNTNSSGNWVVQAPTLALNDGAILDSTSGSNGASMTIHTNNLFMGSSTRGTTVSGNGVTIDDNGGALFSTTGLTITSLVSSNEYIESTGAALSIKASPTSSLLITSSSPSSGSTLNLDTDSGGVSLNAGQTVTVDQNMVVGNTFSASNWTVTANRAVLNPNASIVLNNNATITFSVAPYSMPMQYPADLDLSATNPNLPMNPGGGVIVNAGASVTSNANVNPITINGTSYSSPLTTGNYGGSGMFNVTIQTANGPLQIMQNMNVTPAEWVAAEQVFYGNNMQTLQIGANNAASGGYFTINGPNLAPGGFTNIVIPSANPAITMFLPLAALQTESLTNNGIVAPSGSQTNVTITSAGTPSANFSVSGVGTFNAPSGTVYFQTPAGGTLTIADGTSQQINGNFSATSQSIYMGAPGTNGYTINVTGVLAMHTNALTLGNNALVSGGSVAIDDNGGAFFATTGLTISTTSGSTGYMQATQGTFSISAQASPSSSLFITSSIVGSGTYITFDSPTSVSLSANNQITMGENMSVTNHVSDGAWTVTSPTLALNDGAELNLTTGCCDPTPLTIHTNNLDLGDGSLGFGTHLSGSSVTIDDNSSLVSSTSGVTITLESGETSYIMAQNGALAINAQASPTSSLSITPSSTGSSTLNLDANSGVSLAANNQIMIGENTNLGHYNSSSAWTLTAPTVQLGDGSTINIANGQASNLTIHTNNLNLGDDSNLQEVSIYGKNVTIDEAGMVLPGLAIKTSDLGVGYLYAVSGGLAINATASPTSSLLITEITPGVGSELLLDGNSVSLTANQQVTFDQQMFVGNYQTAGGWTVTAASATLGTNSMIYLTNGNTITFNTNAYGMTMAYPQGLDLSVQNPQLTIPLGGGVTLVSGASITTNAGGQPITINGTSYASPLNTPGTYGGPGTFSVQITVGSGMLTVGPGTNVTPAEWVAAEQVEYGTGPSPQTLTIAANNAASGGNFIVANANIPLGGFTTIVIPETTNGITMNVSASIVSTEALVNNGIVAPSGQNDIVITSVGTASGNLQVSGVGSFNAPSGTAYFQAAAGGTLTFADGTAQTVTGNFSATSPSIYVGSPAVSRTISASGSMNIDTNALSLGSSAVMVGASVTIDDNGGPLFGTTGLTITEVSGAFDSIHAISGALTINATASPNSSLLITSTNAGNITGLTLDGATGVSFTANDQITFGGNMVVVNSVSHANWTLTAPAVAFNDEDLLQITGGSGPAMLAIHTNNLFLGNGNNGSVNIIANGITIDDNGGAVFSTTGLTITAESGQQESVQSVGGTLVINATASANSSLLLTSTNSQGAFLALDGDSGVSLTANKQVTVDQNMYVANSNSSGNWTVTAPTVQLNDNGEIDTTNSGTVASLTIHTNNLNMGNNSNGNSTYIYGNGVTIDDMGGAVFSTTGLTITTSDQNGEFIQSDGGSLAINATASANSSLLITEITPGQGAALIFGGPHGVALTANGQITVDQNMFVGNDNSTGNWVITAQTVQLNDGGGIDAAVGSAPATLTIHTNNLNLGDGSNGGGVDLVGNGVTIDDTGMSTAGLTITAYSANPGEQIYAITSGANAGALAISSRGVLSLVSKQPGTGSTLLLDGDASVTLSGSSQISIGENTSVENYSSSGAWTLTAPTVALADGSAINATNSANGADVTIHTNTLNMGDGSNGLTTFIFGNNLTINDTGMASPGLTISGEPDTNFPEVLEASSGTLTITAAANATDTLLINAQNVASGAAFLMAGTGGVNVQANASITFGANTVVIDVYTQGNWIATSPSVQLNAGSILIAPNGTTSLTIHTNALGLGSGTNSTAAMIEGNSVTVNDSTMTTGGLTITAADSSTEGINATNGALSISAANGTANLLFTSSTAGTGSTIQLDGSTGVALSATGQVTFAPNMTVENSTSSGNWTVTAPTVSLGDGSTLNASNGGAALTIHTNNLNIGENGNTVEISAASVTVSDAGLATGGVTVTVAGSGLDVIFANPGDINFTATNGSAGLTFQPASVGASPELALDGTTSNLESSSQIVVSNDIRLVAGSALNFQLDSAAGLVVNGQVISNGGNVNVSGDGFDPLVMTMGPGSDFGARAGGSVYFNPTIATNVEITGGPNNGVIEGSSINFNFGNGVASVSVNVNLALGTINARTSSISVNTNNNTLTVGAITMPLAGGPMSFVNAGGDVALTQTLTSNGGAITLNASGNITGGQNVNASASSTTPGGGGGTITLTAPNLVVGAVTSSGASTGAGGSITISSNSSTTLMVGGSTANSTGAISAQGGATSGNGGSVEVENLGGGITLSSLGDISVNPLGTGAGGSVTLNAESALAISSGNVIDANANGSGAGGSVSITAQTVSASSSNVSVNANGAGMGKGGSVSIDLTDASANLIVGSSAGDYAVNVNGGTSGSAGMVTLTANSVTVNTGSLSATAGTGGTGATLDFTAGTNLLVTGGSLSANGGTGGAGGTIALESNETTQFFTPFNIDSAETTNGVAGNISATGTPGTGSVTVENVSGNIVVAAGNSVTTSGNVKFTTLDTFTNNGTVTATGTINVDPTNFSNTGTMQSATALDIQVINGTFTNTGSLQYTGASTGVVSINVNAGSSVASSMTMLGAGTLSAGAGNTISFTQPMSILLDSSLSQTISTGAQMNISTPLLQGNTGTPTFNASTSGAAFSLTSTGSTLELEVVGNGTPALTFQNGAVNVAVTNLQVDSNVTLSASSNAANMTLNGGTLTNSGKIVGSTVSATSNGTLTLGGMGTFSASQAVSFTAATSVSLENNTSVSVTNGGGLQVVTPLLVMGAGSDVGGAVATIATNGGAISFAANSTSTGTFEVSLLSGVLVGILNLNGASSTLTATNVQLDTGLELVSHNALTINANGGTLTQNATLIAQSGITVASSSTLALSGAGSFSPAAGQVTTFKAPTSVAFASSTDFTLESGTLAMQTPNVVIGVAGDPASVNATVSGGAASIQANSSGTGTLQVSLGSGVTTGQLNLNGGQVTTTSSSLTLNAGTTLSNDTGVMLNVNGGTFTDNGGIVYTGTEENVTVVVTQSTNGLTVAGTTGTFDVGATNVVAFYSTGNAMSFANGTNLTATTGSMALVAPKVVLGTGSDSGVVSVTLTAGSVTISPSLTGDGTVEFALLGSPVTSGTLNLSAEGASISGDNVIIDANAAVSETGGGIVVIPVNGTFTNNGSISGTAVTVNSPGTLVLAGSGQFAATGSGGGAQVLFNPVTSLSFANGTSLTVTQGPVVINSALVVLGAGADAADVTAMLATTSSQTITMENLSGETIQVSLYSGLATGSTGVLNLNTHNASVFATSTNLTMDAGTELASNSPLTVTVSGNLANNGTLQASGLLGFTVNGGTFANNGVASGDGIIVTSASTLTLSGAGTLTPGSANELLINPGGALTLANGTNQVVSNGTLTVNTPAVILGSLTDSGNVTAILTTNNTSAVTLSSSGALAVTLGSANVTSGTLSFDDTGTNTASLNVSASGTGMTMQAGTMLTASGAVAVNVTGATSPVTLASLLAYGGGLSFNATGGTSSLMVQNNSSLTASNGTLSIKNQNTGGTITFGMNDSVIAGSGNVQILIGNTPSTVAGKAPKNVKVTLVNKGTVLFGTNSITAVAPTNTIFANGSTTSVNFNAGSSAAGITLGGGDTISASATPLLTSLDLNYAPVAQFIKMEQTAKIIGGSLILANGTTGPAIGGTVILTPKLLAPMLTAENIPTGVTATLNSFTTSTPLSVGLNSASTSDEVFINGVEKISGNAIINVTSSMPGEVFNVGSTGSLTGTASLQLNAAGQVTLNGIVNAKTTLTVITTNSGDISVGGTVGTSGSGVVLTTGGNGSILQGTSAGTIVGKTVKLTTNAGNIGGTFALTTKAGTLTLTAGGNGVVNVSNIGTTILANSASGSNFTLADTGKLTLNGITDAAGLLTVSATGGLTVNASQTIEAENGSVTLFTTSTGTGKPGPLAIGTSAVIEAGSATAGLGDVTLTIGLPPSSGTNPASGSLTNITITQTAGGQVFLGSGGTTGIVTKKAPNSVITATGMDVIFNTTVPKAVITLGSGVQITAQDTPISFQSLHGDDEQVVDTGDDGQVDGDMDSFMPVEALSH